METASRGQVFVNRTLNMKKINYIGLDMDHTLIRYNTENFERLAYQCMLTKLVEEQNYPKQILELEFDFKRAIRGLVIDKAQGNILKLSRHASIRESFHGTKRIRFAEQKRVYKSTYIDIGDPNYVPVDTSFSYSFATLFAQLVDLRDSSLKDELPEYVNIANDLIAVLDQAHADGSIKHEVRDNLDKYIVKDPSIVEGLENYKKHGKKIFIATNSDYFYSKLLLDYAVTPFLKAHESWIDLFEFVITLTQKPRFFYDKLDFLKVNPMDGTMTNAERVEPGGIYQGGCANKLTGALKITPEEILYIGDHIYGDVVRLKKDCAWRTALVVEEISEEIEAAIQAQPVVDKIDALMNKKVPLEMEIDRLVSEQIVSGSKDHDKAIKDLMAQISEIDSQVSPLIKEQRSNFNPYWGEVFRTGIEESYFAYQVDRFACIYMARLSDLLSMSPRTYFRSHKKPLSHELRDGLE